jgi:hypothetical protein
MLRETYDGRSGIDRLFNYASFFQFCRLTAVVLALLRRRRSASAWVRLVAFNRVSRSAECCATNTYDGTIDRRARTVSLLPKFGVFSERGE